MRERSQVVAFHRSRVLCVNRSERRGGGTKSWGWSGDGGQEVGVRGQEGGIRGQEGGVRRQEGGIRGQEGGVRRQEGVIRRGRRH